MSGPRVDEEREVPAPAAGGEAGPALGALVAVVGPTASGKSALGVTLAEEHGGEIVSCDSLQVYRGFDIGSAKPTQEERQRVPHHLLDVRDPDQDFSAADYARRARLALTEIRGRGRLPIVVGGTGLYLRALLTGLFEGPSRNEVLRARLEALGDRFGNRRLHRLLTRVDPQAALRIHPSDRLRVIRGLEVFAATGRPLSELQRQALDPLRGYDVLIVGLDPPVAELAVLIRRRVADMWAAGWLDEVRELRRRYGASLRSLGAIGYRQVGEVLDGRLTAEHAQSSIVMETLRYAKRQRTWFRHQTKVQWFASARFAQEAVRTWLSASTS